MKPRRLLLEVVCVSLLFGLTAIYIFQPVLPDPTTVAHPGDGQGTIGWIYDIAEQVNEHGLSVIPGDTYHSIGMGGGLDTKGQPTNPAWKLIYWALCLFFNANDAYDATAALGWAFIGVAGFCLTRIIGAQLVLAVFCGILLCGLDNFSSRINGHITLATYAMPIFLLCGTLVAMRRPTALRLSGVALLVTGNFLMNEYYGYFGVFVTAALLIAGQFTSVIEGVPRPQLLARSVIIAAMVFIGSMSLSYPHQLFDRFSATPQQTVADYSHSFNDFKNYSARSFGFLLAPTIPWLRAALPDKPFWGTGEPGENTYRLGFVVGSSAILGTLGMLWWRWRRGPKEVGGPLRTIACLWFGAFIAICLALKPTKAISLAWLTYAIAPMFRCGVRALLYCDIAITGIFILVLSFYGRALQSKLAGASSGWRRRLSGLGAALVFSPLVYLAYLDVYGGRSLFGQFSGPTIEVPEIYRRLAVLPKGHIFELPFYHPSANSPEDDYPYFVGRLTHGMPIVNGLHFARYPREMDRMAVDFCLNDGWPPTIALLRDSGVRYLLTHRNNTHKFAALAQNPILRKITETEDGALYELVGSTGKFDKERFRALIYAPETRPAPCH